MVQFFNHFGGQGGSNFRQNLVKGIYGHSIVMPGFILPFKSVLCDLVKQVFYVGGRISGCHLDDLAQVDITRVELGKVVFQDSFPSGRVKLTYRYDTIKPAWPKQRCIQLADIVGGADQQEIVLVGLKKRHLFSAMS
jgi:hypothetical protein